MRSRPISSACPATSATAPTAFVGVGWSTLDTLFVRVVTDEGIEGWGEGFGHACCPATRAVVDTQLAPAVLGEDARDIRGLMTRVAQRLHLFGRNGPHIYALSALDVALWDIAGKAANLPLWRLLGGAPVGRSTRLCQPASLQRPCRSRQGLRACSRTRLPRDQAARDRRAAGRGRARGRRARMFRSCSTSTALDASTRRSRWPDRLQPYDLAWLEEPFWPPEHHAGSRPCPPRRAACGSPAGENAAGLFDVRAMLDVNAVDIIQPSVAKIGGITEVMKIAAVAEAAGVRLVPHCAYFGPGFLASLHLAAALAPAAPFERLFVDLEASPYHDLVEVKGGRVTVPDGPGLGSRSRSRHPSPLRALGADRSARLTGTVHEDHPPAHGCRRSADQPAHHERHLRHSLDELHPLLSGNRPGTCRRRTGARDQWAARQGPARNGAQPRAAGSGARPDARRQRQRAGVEGAEFPWL